MRGEICPTCHGRAGPGCWCDWRENGPSRGRVRAGDPVMHVEIEQTKEAPERRGGVSMEKVYVAKALGFIGRAPSKSGAIDAALLEARESIPTDGRVRVRVGREWEDGMSAGGTKEMLVSVKWRPDWVEVGGTGNVVPE